MKGEYVIQKVNLEKVKYGEVETKAAISNIVREVVRSYKFTNLHALDAILQQFGITADGGKPGSRLYDKHGLVYSLLDEEGGRIGVPVKASDIYSKPTKATLEKKYTLSAIMRQPGAARVFACDAGRLIFFGWIFRLLGEEERVRRGRPLMFHRARGNRHLRDRFRNLRADSRRFER